MPTITLNGDARDIAPGATVGGLLDELGLRDRPVAVERNRGVVRRTDFDQTGLKEGDTVEVVSFVPGG